MVFSSPTFILLFLPVVLVGYFLLPGKAKNYWLLSASLLFYFVGEQKYIVVMLISIIGNHIFGTLIDKQNERSRQRRLLAAAVFLNVSLLAFFKYTNFIVDTFNTILSATGLPTITIAPIHLPIGISFFTFQALSYIIDVYRKDAKIQPRLANTALYISFFPQLIAGPIVRYHDIASELISRVVHREGFAEGIKRFITGLAKKMLIANPLALTADQIFALPAEQLTTPVAWLGVLCYTLQIYFDFSGYSDMAIGLGLMFGFHFPENFNYPYVSSSIREFWQRWHISLTNWFRDYLYIPLGGNRRSTQRTYLNLLIVYFLSGLWHGASWTFVVWGLYHGFFMAIERLGFETLLSKIWSPFRHLYTLLIIMVGWVFFRSDTIAGAWEYLRVMFSLTPPVASKSAIPEYLTPGITGIIIISVLVSMPLSEYWQRWTEKVLSRQDDRRAVYFELAQAVLYLVFLIVIFVGSLIQVADDTYNPFIYFRF